VSRLPRLAGKRRNFTHTLVRRFVFAQPLKRWVAHVTVAGPLRERNFAHELQTRPSVGAAERGTSEIGGACVQAAIDSDRTEGTRDGSRRARQE
jgi:hypothetical protein